MRRKESIQTKSIVNYNGLIIQVHQLEGTILENQHLKELNYLNTFENSEYSKTGLFSLVGLVTRKPGLLHVSYKVAD